MAILPVFGLILLGYGLARGRFLGVEFWAGADKLTYYVFFPALLFVAISKPSAPLENLGAVVGAITLILLLASAILWVLKPLLRLSHAEFIAYFQGGIRFNTFIGLSLISALWGERGLFYASLIISFMIPFINILCVTILSFSAPQERFSLVKPLREMAKNPLILACVAGLAWRYAGLGLGEAWLHFLTILGRAALPLGLLSIGTALRLRGLVSFNLALGIFGAFKLVALPFLAYGVGRFFALEGEVLAVLVLLFALPSASSSYILTRQFGGDLALMSKIITLETLLSVATLALGAQGLVEAWR